MKKLLIKYLTFFFAFTFLHTNHILAQKEADGALGIWLSQTEEAKLKIYKCGKSGNKYCGKIIWLKEPNEEDGTPKVDKENPNAKLRNRSIINLVIMKGFIYDEDNVWEDGTIYDPKSGSTYSCKMTLKSKNTLDIRGYIGFSFLGRTEVWTRVE